MREPFFDRKGAVPAADRTTKETGAARRSGATVSSMAATEGGRRKAQARPSSRGPLPRVPGGKALARLNFFEQQRQIEPTEPDKRKRAAGPSAGRRSAARDSTRPAARETASARAANVSPYRAAFERKAHLDATAAADPVEQAWRPIGPFSIPHGQTYGKGAGSRPPVAGRIVAVAVDPGNPSHVLIGAGGGGVWETKDAGRLWQPRTDTQPSLSIGAVAFDPANPLNVYAGTGEGDSISALGVGLLRSSDGGTTWMLHASAPFEGLGFYELVVDSLDGNHLLAATTHGLFESTNGGAAWTRRRAQPTWSISMHPAVSGDATSTKEVFAACGDGIFRSTNGGSSWTKVPLTGMRSGVERLEVQHAPSDGNVVYIWGAANPQILDPVDSTPDEDVFMPKPYLWRRNVRGGVFAAQATPPDVQTGQAWYDWFAAVAPNNPDVLYVGAINVHLGTRLVSGNWTWVNIGAKTSGDSIHPDQHAIAFSPVDPNVLYVGNDGGIYRSSDAGTTWQPLNKGLNITEFEFLAQHPQFETWLIGGTQDNGSVRYEGQEVWFHVEDGDGGDCGVNGDSPYSCYHTFYGIGMERSSRGGAWGTWTWIGPEVDPAENYPDGALFYPPLEVNGRLVVQAGRRVYISSDSGRNWTSVSLPAAAGFASALAAPTATRIYVGTEKGRLYRMALAGGTWSAPVSLGRPASGYLSDVLTDATNPNRLWLTYSSLEEGVMGGRVFRSDNAGASWQDVAGDLPNIALNAIELDPENPDTVFVAADVGVFRSTNAGAVWTAFSNGLPNALVKDLLFHARSRLLRAATQSRGVWEIAVDQATIPGVEIYLRDSTADSGRSSPSPSGVADPFTFGAQTFWWQCQDIKVDSPTFQKPLSSDVDFECFEDDHGIFAAGLVHENAQRNRMVRVFVQVHNRGVLPALNVAVKVFFAASAVTLPNLPTGFWSGFPNNVLPSDSPWQPIGPPKVVARVECGGAEIVPFDWTVPGTAPPNASLLAIMTADNDSIATSELNIATLVTQNKKCGLTNTTVVNPSPETGPMVRALHLDLLASGASSIASLELDRASVRMIRGIVLSKRLAALAQKVKLKAVRLSADDRDELTKLTQASPRLRRQLHVKTAFAARAGAWLERIQLTADKPEPIVLLVDAAARKGYGSIIQRAADGTVVGGFTLQSIG